MVQVWYALYGNLKPAIILLPFLFDLGFRHVSAGLPEIVINLSQVVEAAKKWGQQQRAARVWSSWVATLAQTSLLPHGHYYGNNDYYYYRRIAIYWSAAPENLRIVRAQRRSHPAGPLEDIGMVEKVSMRCFKTQSLVSLFSALIGAKS